MAGFVPPFSAVAPGPASHAFAVVPSDTVDLPHLTRMIWVGGAGSGNLTVILAGDTLPVILAGIASGTMVEVCAKRVMATGTDTLLMIGMW